VWVPWPSVGIVIGDAPATLPPASTLRVTVLTPLPPSAPVMTTVGTAVYQPAPQTPPAQVIEAVGAVRSEMPFCAALLPLVKKPAPCAIFVWTTYS